MTDETRTPARPRYDALVDMGYGKMGAEWAYGLVKHTFRLDGARWVISEPEPLLHDIRREDIVPRIAPHTDFFPYKRASDVVVRGAAMAPEKKPVRKLRAAITVGRLTKTVAIFGERRISWPAAGRMTIEEPEPFEEMPLVWERAYGGIDFRVPVPNFENAEVKLLLQVDHPGAYPRNPMGKGYFVEKDALDGAFMPNLENPQDLLDGARIALGDPELWHRQPLPWCLDWTHLVQFPRLVLFGMGAEPWFPPPYDESLEEIRRGFLVPKTKRAKRGPELSPELDEMFYQGGSHGLTFRNLRPKTPIVLESMHPTRPRMELVVPAPPKIELILKGRRLDTKVALHHIVCHPNEECFTIVHGAMAELGRTLIPGIHKNIPLSMRVEGDAPLEYDAPETVAAQLAAGRKRHAEREAASRASAEDES